jgi:hypothetical protein
LARAGHGQCLEFFACECGEPLRKRSRASAREATHARELFERLVRQG